MASLGHIAVGIAAARAFGSGHQVGTWRTRVPLGAAAFWSALSFLPDADVIGFSFGVRYEDEWGHRGATHSLLFSLALGTAVGLLAPVFRRPGLRTGVMACLVLASHALLDTLTDGGLGCALFWPFDMTRYFAPWRPIPVSPIGAAFFSPYGMYVAATELVLFAPVLWLALRTPAHAAAAPVVQNRLQSGRPSRRGLFVVAGWVAAFWLLMSSDPVREQIVRVILRDDTEYAPGFSDERLRSIEFGDSVDTVRQRLGAPFREFPAGPQGTCWLYSRSPDGGYFRARAVCFTEGRVSAVVRRWVR